MLLLFLRMSTTGLTARARGAKIRSAARALVQPLATALGAGVLIILLRLPLIDLALHIVGGSEAVLEQARRFLEIRWLSAPASLANWCCSAGCWASSTPGRRLFCWWWVIC